MHALDPYQAAEAAAQAERCDDSAKPAIDRRREGGNASSLRTLESILSYLSGRVYSSPAYRFLLISRYGQYTCAAGEGLGSINERLIHELVRTVDPRRHGGRAAQPAHFQLPVAGILVQGSGPGL